MLTRRHLLGSTAAAAVAAAVPQATAQSGYASQPVHILVGYAAGGGVDIIARLLQDPMKAALGQPIIVENRAGASAMLATAAVAKAAPDGYTLLACASGEVAINHFLFKEKMTYDPAKELAPIALVGIVPASSFDSPFHPVRVYAAGDLAVAYLVSEDDGDHITSRALCWPSKKTFGRVYGDEKLEQILANDGWRHSSSFAVGAKMQKHLYGDDCYVVPYVDGVCRARDAGKFLVIDDCGEINCEVTNGVSEQRRECEHCGDSYREDDGFWIDSREETWCRSCVENDAFYCPDTGQYIAQADGVLMADGEYWSERRFELRGAYCEATGENYALDDTVTLANGTVWNSDYFERHGRQCHACGSCMEADETCESCGDDDASDDEAPRARPHVARQGRDENPAQAELPLTPALSANVGDYVRVECADGGIADGWYRVSYVDDGDTSMRVLIEIGTRRYTWWLRNTYVKDVRPPALHASVGDTVRVRGDSTIPDGEYRVTGVDENDYAQLPGGLTRANFANCALVVRVLTTTGMRWGELAGLKPEQIEPENGCIRLWETKNGEARTVPIEPGKAKELKWLVHTKTLPTYYTFRNRLKAAAKDAGQSEQLCVHSLRHTTATRLTQRGVPIQVVQKYLGHKTIITTTKYAHINDQLLQEAHEKISPHAGQTEGSPKSVTEKV